MGQARSIRLSAGFWLSAGSRSALCAGLLSWAEMREGTREPLVVAADASFHQIGDPFSLWPCPVWRPVRIGLIKGEAKR